jgi:lysophospholipase L1-like esterase
MLGSNDSTFEVINYGVSGRTMMKTGDYPYWNEEAYQLALASEADVVLLMLGTNDAKTYQWNETEYVADYLEMAASFLNMPSSPQLYIMVPPPLYLDNAYSMSQQV